METLRAVADALLSVVCPDTTALVVVEFPTIRLVIELRVAIKDEIKELVEVALVEKRLVAVNAVAEAVARLV